jgi:hypothetical protein
VYVTYTSGTRTEQRREEPVLQALTVSIVGMKTETPTLEVRMEASTTGLTEVLLRRLLLTKASSALSDIVKDNFLPELLMELKFGLQVVFLETQPRETISALLRSEESITSKDK